MLSFNQLSMTFQSLFKLFKSLPYKSNIRQYAIPTAKTLSLVKIILFPTKLKEISCNYADYVNEMIKLKKYAHINVLNTAVLKTCKKMTVFFPDKLNMTKLIVNESLSHVLWYIYVLIFLVHYHLIS